MHKVADVTVAKNIMEANKKLADKNKERFDKRDIFCVDFVGAIGSGKTSLIEKYIDATHDKIGVIAGDIISKFDAGRIEKHNVPVVGLNTGNECHLDAHLVEHGLIDMPLEDIDYLFIENVGNLICPVDFDLGSHMRVVVVSVTEGDDTVEKHPLIFQSADLVVINKIDLAEAVGASTEKMVEDAKSLNPDVKVIATNLKEDPTSVSIFTYSLEMQPIIKEKIIAKFGDEIEVRTWGGFAPCLEVVSAGVQKAMGVEQISFHYGIKQENILAFGDEDNDYEMIQYAGHGVAMLNGIDELKKIASDVTFKNNHDDGLADYLEKYFKI